jgi:putative membrane protein
MSGRSTPILALTVLSTLWPGVSAAEERVYEWSWSMHPMAWLWGVWGAGMLLVMVLFWALIVAGIVLGLRWLSRLGTPQRSDAALEILRQRYARGEIGREEFEAKKRDLAGS